MSRQTISISDENKELLSHLFKENGFKTESSYINYLISTHPDMLTAKLEKTKSLNMTIDENKTDSSSIQNEELDQNEVNTDSIRPIFTGEDALDIKMRAKELNLSIPKYLMLCHNKTMPVILDNDNIDTLILMQDYEELKNMIVDESNAVINILKNTSSAVSRDTLSTVEDKQNNILNYLSDIKKIIKELILEVENGYSQSVKGLKKYLKSHHIDSYGLRKGDE